MRQQTRHKTIPRSHAKTAYGLISDVVRAIESEPKRIDMSCIIGNALYGCGTVGCFAGWVLLLAKGKRLASILVDHNGTYAAQDILGRLDYQTVGPQRSYVFNDGPGDACGMTSPGTKEHAQAVIARIRHFQEVNAVALRRRKL